LIAAGKKSLYNVNSTGRKIVPRALRAERFFSIWAALCAAQMEKLSQHRASKKQKVLQKSNPFVSETFVSFGLLAGAPALETDVVQRAFLPAAARLSLNSNSLFSLSK
jgi:hypothetical protein